MRVYQTQQNTRENVIIVTEKEGIEKEQYRTEVIQRYSRLLACVPIGKANALHEKQLIEIYGNNITIRQFQKILNSARNEGVIICSDNSGVFLPKSIEELKDFYHINHSRSLNTLKMLKGVKKLLKEVS